MDLLDKIVKITLGIISSIFLTEIVFAAIAVALKTVISIVLKEGHSKFKLLFFAGNFIGGFVHARNESFNIILAIVEASLFNAGKTLINELFSLLELLLKFAGEIVQLLFILI